MIYFFFSSAFVLIIGRYTGLFPLGPASELGTIKWLEFECGFGISPGTSPDQISRVISPRRMVPPVDLLGVTCGVRWFV